MYVFRATNAALQMAEGRIEILKVNTQASSSGYLTFTHTSSIFGEKKQTN